MVITDRSMENVVLFPKTVQVYEEELTRLLQTEQYVEAYRLLAYLLSFSGVEEDKTEQWGALLHWLQMMFPETVFPGGEQDGESEEQEEEHEHELLKQHVHGRASGDRSYPDKLLRMLYSGSMEQQAMAVEQLAFVDHPQAGPGVRAWLRQVVPHPHLQFKALQTLKRLGEKGQLKLIKNGKRIVVDIEETPLTADDYPLQIREMLQRVEEISEADQPDLAYFAEQTWQEFIAFSYGTPLYRELQGQEEGNVDLWASALHGVLQERLFGGVRHAELFELYGIVEALQPRWQQIYDTMRLFMNTMLTGKN